MLDSYKTLLFIPENDINLPQDINPFPIESETIKELKQFINTINDLNFTSTCNEFFYTLQRNSINKSYTSDTYDFQLAKLRYTLLLNALATKLNQHNDNKDVLFNLEFIEFYQKLIKDETPETGFFPIVIPIELEVELQSVKHKPDKPRQTLIEIYLTDIINQFVNTSIQSQPKDKEYANKLLSLIASTINIIKERVLFYVQEDSKTIDLALLNQICINVMKIQANIFNNQDISPAYIKNFLVNEEDAIGVGVVVGVFVVTLNFCSAFQQNLSEIYNKMRSIAISDDNRHKPKIMKINESLYPFETVIDLNIIYDPSYNSISELIELMKMILEVR